ncbi:hypothetical protein A2331_02190 [Candidatus Falkowbacteria bacterium RIFOXYB2_FULL_34_18]|uniref:Phosphoribosyltransferase domain-containing protein n=1 Tax=Candidatus Falkowbacteria bacterium RIFOXYD2_FULL_34_120 TaxID=1798007 RepID=A0A1F5TQP1_9BACT|nr:MAG: hypothetical protein A2331_02190 [Candidatus Falkowbacteria bacterium RIFOXYB2_FULL_34_18]OGF29522.1 MAG: hypothetical protein A2500_02340 [Candidatus Falkowbacteria bacterium RIFOXYC12_FULL_34_55]OGF36868.1 MAG: hypothetical protein A2466_06630 [Candidatus Falkowbacteria bacterium RIFOXYC2_FULL_34_220]OGF39067.1 MAG: hypothetical protein A2515_04635 [Candidatus Falkowbacteria bacterium RIFOXYD12_FULL_34_57]OGF41280.1 MAG: hypothetical protein A2531_00255 [Candidatus Falkowbacteria bact
MNFDKIKNQVITPLLDFIFPIECVGCQKEGEWLCEPCFEKLSFYKNQYCPICKQEGLMGKFCPNCKPFYEIDRIFIAGNYKNIVIADLIKKLKFYSVKNIANILGEYLYVFIKKEIKIFDKNNHPSFPLKKTLIVPVPLSHKRYNFRTFNQSEEIAKFLAKKCKLPTSNNLIKIKHTKPQTKLKRENRLKNIKNCFKWEGENLNKKNILLIDDVVTTGSTLNECARELKKHGAGKIWGLVVAKG